MTFTLTIELGNDAMQTGGDLARALADAAHKIMRQSCHETLTRVDGGKIMDANGNSVGQWEVK